MIQNFEITDIRLISYYLGMEIKQNKKVSLFYKQDM